MSMLRIAVWLSPGATGDGVLEVLARAAEQFVRAGGSPTLAEWMGLDEFERAALISARERIEAERAARTGMAAQGAEGVARALASADGGAAFVRLRLEQAISETRAQEQA